MHGARTRSCTNNNVDTRCEHDKTTICSPNYLYGIPLTSRLFRNPSVSLSNVIAWIPLSIECKAGAASDSNEVLNCTGRRVRSKGVTAESTMTVSRYYLGYRCVTLTKIAYSATLRILSEMSVFFSLEGVSVQRSRSGHVSQCITMIFVTWTLTSKTILQNVQKNKWNNGYDTSSVAFGALLCYLVLSIPIVPTSSSSSSSSLSFQAS